MTALPTVNIELLDRVMEWVEQSHEKQEMIRAEKGQDLSFIAMTEALGTDIWHQAEWRTVTDCGTAMCFAGAACEFSGVQWKQGKDNNITVGGECVDAAAIRLLGLTWKEGDALFNGWNPVEDLRRIIAEIKAGVYR